MNFLREYLSKSEPATRVRYVAHGPNGEHCSGPIHVVNPAQGVIELPELSPELELSARGGKWHVTLEVEFPNA